MKACHTLNKHGEEDDVHADQGGPEVEMVECFTHVPTRDFRIPMEDSTEEAKQDSGSNHVVEMPDYIIGVMQVQPDKIEC